MLDDLTAVLLTLVALATTVLWAANRWKYRALPGPFAPPLIGNLIDVVRYGFHEYLDMCRRKYGRVFKIYLGSVPFIVCADPDLSRRINNRLVDRMLGPQLSADKDGKDDDSLLGLATANGEEWRSLRLAWQPAFQSGSLERYSLLMDSCALRLCEQLHEAANEGKAIDMWRSLGTMTMGVVGTTAFGIDLHTMDDPSSDTYEQGHKLLNASARVFSSSSFVNGSAYQPLLLMFPRAQQAVKWVAARMPDYALVELTKARRVIREVSSGLISNWRAANAAAVSAPPMHAGDEDAPDAPATAAAAGGRDQAPKTAAGGSEDEIAAAKRRAGLGVAPGSFLGLLLGARERGTEKGGEKGAEKFSDAQIIAQANTFILAGYETTANTLSYCVYNIAGNPRVQERLLAEVDAFGRDRQITHADLATSFPYAEAVIKESLRLFPPAIMTNRRVNRDEGFQLLPNLHIKKGVSIFTAPYCYQRDEAYWPAALEFRPERFLPEGSALAPTTDDAWTPFGDGARKCIGWRFALNEAKIALIRLHQRFTFELQPGQVPLALRQGLTLSPAKGVWVTPVVRPAAAAAAEAAAGAAAEAPVVAPAAA